MTDQPAAVPRAVRDQLAAARADGMTFDEAWPAAVAAATRRATDRDEWRQTLTETRPAWEAAWRGDDPARPLLALLALVDDPDREPIDDGPLIVGGERICRHCDRPIPSAKPARARYCSSRCRNNASYRRVAAAA